MQYYFVNIQNEQARFSPFAQVGTAGSLYLLQFSILSINPFPGVHTLPTICEEVLV